MQDKQKIVLTLKDRQERLFKIRGDRKLLEAAVVHYKTNPADFINDWMMTYDPREEVKLIPFTLFPRQAEYIDWLYDLYNKKSDGLVEKTRDMGATWLCCAYAVWMWIFYPQASIAFGSRKESMVDEIGNPDSIFEKMRMILFYLPQEFLPHGFDQKKHATHMKIINPVNGATIKGEAGDNIGRGGRSSIYFKDESAHYEHPDKIEAALSMNSECKIDISTPNGNGNLFYRKRHGGKIPVFTFFWDQDPRKDQKWFDEKKRTLDPVIFAQEVMIDYNASVGNVFIPSEGVREAMSRRYADVFGREENRAPVTIGVDVARFGDDRTVIACRQGRVLSWFNVINQASNTEIAGHIINLCSTMHVDAICVDVVGVGSGVYDILNEKYNYVYPVNGGSKAYDSAKYFNRRAETWGRFRDWLKDEAPIIPNDEEMLTDLCSLQYKFNSNGQYVLEKKEDAKKRGVRSPDIGDAIALTFAELVGHRDMEYLESNSYSTRDSRTGY
jgi:hypothetical protein